MDRNRLAMRLVPIAVGLVVIGAIVVKGCQEGPFGRNQVVALNHEEEAALGVQAFREVLRKSDVLPDGPTVDAVNTVVRRLAAATSDKEFLKLTKQEPQKFEWAVRVVRSREVNAFCLPGGKMVVYTGILPVAETDAGLAVVMGHEISHALGHHGAERMAQQQIAQIGVASAGASLGDMDPQQRQQVMQVLNAGATYGILKYSRSHESEADHMGLLLMAAAGYDPHEAPKFWERMQRASRGGGPPEFLSTHPSHETRIRDLNGWLDEALPLYKAAGSASKPEPLPRQER